MTRSPRRGARRVGVALALLALLGAPPALAHPTTGARDALSDVDGQGTTGSINGTITDNSNAVLPGVTVTATGPAIMGSQSALSNEQGQYRFPSLPPGTYKVAYELAGFTTVIREGIIVNIGFTSTVNVQLSLASLQETVTVTGLSPVIDAQNTNVQTNFTSQMINSLPNARDIWALIAVAPGTTMNSFDVGGSRAGTQTGYSAYGRSDQVRVQVDGVNATEDTGGTGYFNYGAFDEVQIGTDSNDASMPTPGVQINAVIKAGGNTLRGDLYMDYEGEGMQGTNVTDALRRVGVGEGTRITKYYDPNIGVGGPLKRDRLWYFVSARNQRIGTTIAGFPVEQPSDFEFLTKLENITYKLSYQLNQNNKVSQYAEVRRKLQPSRSASNTTYSDAVYKQESISAYGNVDWNSVVSRTFFFNTRLSTWGYNWPNYVYGLDGLEANVQPRRSERLTGNVSGGARADRTFRRRWQFDWTGTLFKDDWLGANHSVKMGFLSERETERYTDEGFEGEYSLSFDSRAGEADFTRPFRVTLENSPRTTTNNLLHNGAYIQDQIVVNRRVTLNAGLRWDYYHVYYPDMVVRPGPFRDFFYAGARLPNGYSVPASYPDFEIPGRSNIVKFTRAFAPRLGVAWDLRADGKTVLKVNWGRFNANPGPQNFINPNQRLTAVFDWNDVNGDRQFTLNELGAFSSSSGGTRNTISPDLTQEFTYDTSVFLERQLTKDVSARVGYVRKEGRNNWQSVELARTYDLYTNARTFPDPGRDGVNGTSDDGAPFVAYDIPSNIPVPASRTDLRTQPDIESWDQNVDFTVNKRMSNRWSLLASVLYNWDHDKGHPQTPNAERFNETNLTDWAFKLFGTFRTPWDIMINPVIRHQAGDNLGRVVPVTLRTGTLNYDAEAPGTYRAPSVTIVDLAGEKRFILPKSRHISVFLAAFNLMNADTATGQDEVVGVRTAVIGTERLPYQRFLRPTGILPPRVFRAGVKVGF